MIHKNIFRTSLLPIVLLALSCNSTKHAGKSQASLPGTWQATPIAIDGDTKDWPSPYPNYDSKGKVAYATSNDRHNLYITMETGDEQTQMKILKQGMTVSIDTTGKKEPGMNINYPLPNDNEQLDIQNLHDPHNKKWEKNVTKFAKQANQYGLEGFGNCNGGYVITQTTACGIKIMMKIDEYKELVWEAVVPLKALYGKDTISASDVGKPISVCFMVNRFKQPSTKGENNAGMNNSMNAGSMQGTGSTGIPGSRSGGGRNISNDPLQHLYEATKTWKQFGLAYQK